MEVYHGTAAKFPPKQLTSGPDSAALLGRPMPGLWLTSSLELAAVYASWSADCTGGDLLRVISMEISDDCPRHRNPSQPEDFVVRYPEAECEKGSLKVKRGYRVRLKKVLLPEFSGWSLRIPELGLKVATHDANSMERLRRGMTALFK